MVNGRVYVCVLTLDIQQPYLMHLEAGQSHI